MVQYNLLYSMVISILCIQTIQPFLFDKIKTAQEAPPTVISKQQLAEDKLALLQEESKKCKESQQAETVALQDALTSITTQIADAKVQKNRLVGGGRALFDEKLARLNEEQQAIFNIQLVSQQILETIDQNILIWEGFLKDPFLKTYELEPHALYTLTDLQSMTSRVLSQEAAVLQLKEQKHDAVADLANRKKKYDSAVKLYDEKTKLQEEFSRKQESPEKKVAVKFQGELLDLEQKLAAYERRLAELRLQETRVKDNLLEANLLIETEKLTLLKNNLQLIKKSLRIEPEDVEKTKIKLEKQRQASHILLIKYYEQIEKLLAYKTDLQKQQDMLTERFNILAAEAAEISSWNRVTDTPEEYQALCAAGSNKTEIHLVNRKIDVLRAQITLEEQQLRRADNNLSILTSWYKISRRQFKDNEQIAQEAKRYKDFVAENNRELTIFKDKRAQVTTILNAQNRSVTNIRTKLTELKKQADYPVQMFGKEVTCSELMAESEKSILDQIDMTTKLVEIYSNIIGMLELSSKEAESIIGELETRSIWRRSEYAITWEGIQNIIPDIERFFGDVRSMAFSYVTRLRTSETGLWLYEAVRDPWSLLYVILYVALFALLVFLVRTYFLKLYRILVRIKFNRADAQSIVHVLAVGAFFMSRYALGLVCWTLLYISVHFMMITDPFLRILFYLASIPYLIYVTIRFVQTIALYNAEHESVLFNITFQRRFLLAFSVLCYITIFVFCFREAFILATLSQSELPTILFAVYSIILRTLVIFSIGKDEILSILPSRGFVWIFLAKFIEKYYYLLLLAIIGLMVMSDPYVGGYSNLVSYLFWGVVGSALVFWVLYLLHLYLKDVSSVIFFHSEEDFSRERFQNAKMWYGVFVIMLFLLFVLIGLFIGARIWDIPFTLKMIAEFWNTEFFVTGYDENKNAIWFTPKKFSVALMVILSGFFFAFALNRYVLRSIFDLLPVELGIQNTVQSILRYIILALAVFLGLQSAGIEGFLVYIGLILASIGWMAKEPLSDFLSYFILLVQRPIQIGDYILITPEIQGVVRQVTPRSVILRRKNSFTIIVPNSMLITHEINNWNYARNYVAFDDILFTVPYDADPILVKQIALKVLDQHPNILKSPAPVIRLENFAPDGFQFLVRGFITDKYILDRWDIASSVRFEIVRMLREHGIRIAVPTRYVISSPDQASQASRDIHQKPE